MTLHRAAQKTDDPRVEKVAERIKRLGDVRLPLEVRLELGEIYADVRSLSILDNERIATRSDECATHGTPFISPGICPYCVETWQDKSARLAQSAETRREWAQRIADQFSVTDAAAIDAIEEGLQRGKMLATPSNEALPDDIAEAVRKMGRVEWGAVGPKSDDEHASDFRDSLFETRVNHHTEGSQALHGLYLEGTETVLCHTGTSPNSANNARALAGAWNWLVDRAALNPPGVE